MKIIAILLLASSTHASEMPKVIAEAAAKGIDMSNPQILQGRDGIEGEAAGDFVIIGANGGCRFERVARPQITCWQTN